MFNFFTTMVERTFESIKGKESNELVGAVGFVPLLGECFYSEGRYYNDYYLSSHDYLVSSKNDEN